jgi:uncharacterized protein
MKHVINPFPTTAYIGPDYFCDRSTETKQLLRDLTSGQSVTLTSVRRIGKTGLIRHVLAQLPKTHNGVYVDILATENLNDFFNVLATAALNAIPETTVTGKKLWTLIRSIRPVFSIDPMTGFPQVSVDFKPHETNHHIESILRFLEDQPHKIVIAIDEFQQILNYPESRTDAWLRSIIQTLTNVVFIFSGSQQHLMMDLFSNPSRPFYRSTGFLKLEKINKDDYASFIIHHMLQNQKIITDSMVNEMIDWAQCHTYYVQLICNRVFRSPVREITRESWMEEALMLLREQEMMFYNYRDLLTVQQWQFLKAVATEEVVYTPTSNAFMSKYHLGSPATVIRSLASLMHSELIYSDYTKDGKLFYGMYDVLFQRWIQYHSFGKL